MERWRWWIINHSRLELEYDRFCLFSTAFFSVLTPFISGDWSDTAGFETSGNAISNIFSGFAYVQRYDQCPNSWITFVYKIPRANSRGESAIIALLKTSSGTQLAANYTLIPL